MVTLPYGFVSTWFPGYFWNTEEQRLYSLKIDGVLKPIRYVTPNHFNHLNEPGYRVSHKGVRRFMPMSKLKALPKHHTDVIPVKDTKKNLFLLVDRKGDSVCILEQFDQNDPVGSSANENMRINRIRTIKISKSFADSLENIIHVSAKDLEAYLLAHGFTPY
jgi:hypothetical protein